VEHSSDFYGEIFMKYNGLASFDGQTVSLSRWLKIFS